MLTRPGAPCNAQARALGVSAAVAATAASTTVLPSQGAAFVHLLAFAVLLVRDGEQTRMHGHAVGMSR